LGIEYYVILPSPFSALTLLVGQQEGIRPVKNWVMGCHCHPLSCSSKSRLVLPF